jgi:hypothetical protein
MEKAVRMNSLIKSPKEAAAMEIKGLFKVLPPAVKVVP